MDKCFMINKLYVRLSRPRTTSLTIRRADATPELRQPARRGKLCHVLPGNPAPGSVNPFQGARRNVCDRVVGH